MLFTGLIFLPFALLLLTVLLLVGLLVRWLIPLNEWLQGKLLPLIFLFWGICYLGGLLWLGGEERVPTTYAKHYSEYNFQQIKAGMSEQQVLDLVGEPLEKWRPYQNNLNFPERQHYICFVYSRSESGVGYELRQVDFDQGSVAEIKSYTYND